MTNLDCMSVDEVKAFAARYDYRKGLSRKDCAELVGDRRKGYTRIAMLIGAYAQNKALAMKYRLAGNINTALGYEAACDSIYDRLPEDLRW